MPSLPARICVVGSANIDLTFRTARLPRPGETLHGSSFQMGYGGKGANQAVMAARLGAQTTLVCRVGRDVFGAGIIRHLTLESLDASYIREDVMQPTGTAAIVVDDAAENCIIVVAGANGLLSPQDVREAASAIQRAQVLLCQLEVPAETVLEAFRLARAAGVQTILNPAPAATLSDELFRLTDLCVPNESELEALAGQSLGGLDEIAAAARMLIDRGPSAVLVTLGARGALIFTADTAEPVPAFHVEAVDPTGAGDAFIGALAVFLAEGREMAEAARWACAAAALSVMRPGAQAAFPSRAEVEGLFLGER
jgi:ribokinase